MSDKLNREEQVQVVIRLKPIPKTQKCIRSVYVSDEQQKTLVVETPNKKQYIVFDNIADQQCTQQQIYQHIGQDAIKLSTDGYNCCIFAYGQTGAGKTYSILGNTQDITNDIYTQSRGILPRLLSDLFSWCSLYTHRFWIKCSYLQIYNQQIIDLLNPDLKLRQIRQDCKQGVFVQGISQENATNYQQAMVILMKGVKNRKTSVTFMNDQSSRSHTIFTLSIQSEIIVQDITKTRRSKINIVDLAGSQRAKQAKAEGQRLKQGCNINKSLHVLGNVINALVESAKKKKHIPFRDSKLTHFLKDSLSGNSITKLLANINPSKTYLGDTLSTLMFAKRVKILKMKVQVNQNMTENFQELRKQIRKLREQLAQAHYIKNQQKIQRNIHQSGTDSINADKIIDISACTLDIPAQEQALKVFQQNQLNYKALIQIYQEHLKNCTLSTTKTKRDISMCTQKKKLQKQNASYRNLLRNFPAFTKIFKQNMMLKSQKCQPPLQKDNTLISKQIHLLGNNKPNVTEYISKNQYIKIKLQYEWLIKQIQTKFTKSLQQLQQSYQQLQQQNKTKQLKIKDLKKRKQLPPNLQQLANQNEYLKLNILQLQNELNTYQQKNKKLMIQLNQLKKELQKNSNLYHQQQYQDIIYQKIHQVKIILQKQQKQLQQQRNSMLNYIDKIKDKLLHYIEQNKLLSQHLESVKQQNKGLKKKLHSLLKINNQIQIGKDQNANTNTFWTNQQSNISQQFEIFNQKNKFQQKSKIQSNFQQDKIKDIELSNQIIKLHKCYNQEIYKLRDQIKGLEQVRRQLSQENYEVNHKLRKFENNQKGNIEIHGSKEKPSKKQRCSSTELLSAKKHNHN